VGPPRLQHVRGALAACAVAVSLSIAAAAAGSGAVIPSGNLLQNPGAEAAPGSNGSGGPVAIPNWTTRTITGDSPTTQGFTVVAYGSPAFPDAAVSAQIGGGANFFGGGNATALSTAAQTVDVSGAAAEIDAGQASAVLSADIGGFDGQTDSGIVSAAFLGAGGNTISTFQIGPVTQADRNSVTTLLPRSATVGVPAGTRSITVTMTAKRDSGSWDDAYFDNIDLELRAGAVAPPPSPSTTPPAPPPPAGALSPPLPPPVGGQSVDVGPFQGTVLVNGQPLVAGQQIGVNSTIDTTQGIVTLTSAGPSGGLQTANFAGGVFKVTQPGASAATQLALTGGNFSVCSARRTAAKPKKKTIVRSLWGNGKGRFVTTGRFASATVRGTVWLTQDRCDGTRIFVKTGSVAVFNRKLRKTVIVTTGHSYFANR
jgi:hypothetical protein